MTYQEEQQRKLTGNILAWKFAAMVAFWIIVLTLGIYIGFKLGQASFQKEECKCCYES